jgi:tetratricopeptide (TPR) repeat protein
MTQNADEKIAEVVTMLTRGDFQDGVDTLEKIWTDLPAQKFALIINNFDAYITRPLDTLLNFMTSLAQYKAIRELLNQLANILYSTPPQFMGDVNNLMGLSTAYSRIGIRYFNNINNENRYDSLESLEKSISIFGESISLIEKARSIEPDLSISLEPYNKTLAHLNCAATKYFGKQELWKEQIPYFEKAVELDPQNDEAWLGLGYSYWGNIENESVYLKCWNRAAELGNAKAIAELERQKIGKKSNLTFEEQKATLEQYLHTVEMDRDRAIDNCVSQSEAEKYPQVIETATTGIHRIEMAFVAGDVNGYLMNMFGAGLVTLYFFRAESRFMLGATPPKKTDLLKLALNDIEKAQSFPDICYTADTLSIIQQLHRAIKAAY